MKILSKFLSYNINNNAKTNLKGFVLSRNYSRHGSMKVTVLGASGRIGETLCLILKKSPLIDELCIHDIKPTFELEKDLNHIDTKCKVTAFSGMNNIQIALKNSKIVAVLVAAPDIDHLSLDKMLEPNSKIVKAIMAQILRICPKALVAIATNPINSIVPIACDILKKGGSYHANSVFGITMLDTIRANTLVAQVQGLEPESVIVPIIGGHSPETTIPVLSQAKPCAEFSNDEIEDLTANIRLIKTKEKIEEIKPIGPLVSAFAIARFTISLVKAVQGCPDIVECAYVRSRVHPFLRYLATPLVLGPNGIAKNLGLPELSDYEKCIFNNAIPIIANDIKRGEQLSTGSFEPGTPHTPSQEVTSRRETELESVFPLRKTPIGHL